MYNLSFISVSLLAITVIGASPASADILIPASALVGPAPGAPGTGLNGIYYFLGGYAATQNLTNLAEIQAALPAPTATFLGAVLNYNASDAASVESWLGADGPSLQPDPNAGSNGIQTSYFDFYGFISVTSPTLTFTIGSDDGAALFIGGIQVANTDGVHPLETSTVTADFSQNGLYAINLEYFNRALQDGSGAAQLQFAGAPLGSLYDPTVPEPATAALLVAGLLALALTKRRMLPRKSAHKTVRQWASLS